MEIETFTIDPDNEYVDARPFLRFSDDQDCSIEGCDCSPGKWLTVSNGTTAIKVTLTQQEAAEIRRGFTNITLTSG